MQSAFGLRGKKCERERVSECEQIWLLCTLHAIYDIKLTWYSYGSVLSRYHFYVNLFCCGDTCWCDWKLLFLAILYKQCKTGLQLKVMTKKKIESAPQSGTHKANEKRIQNEGKRKTKTAQNKYFHLVLLHLDGAIIMVCKRYS